MPFFTVILLGSFLHLSQATPPPLLTRQTDHRPLDELVDDLNAARTDKADKEATISLCEKILSRDVIADFITHGTSPVDSALGELLRIHELAPRVEAWKEALEENPRSERLNYLLAIAARHYRAKSPNLGRPGIYPPVRIKITRRGAEFTAEFINQRGRWEELGSTVTISMPRKALIGLAGNHTTGRFKELTLTASGAPVSDPEWQTTQIGGDSTRGKLESLGDTLQLTGVGAKPSLQTADSHFFAYREMEGDGSLEVVVDEIANENRYGAVGIMIRGSLEPSASFAAVMLERDEAVLRVWTRVEHDDLPGYLSTLCSLRPHDAPFVLACLREMTSHNMTGAAYQAAERLLKNDPTAFMEAPETFQDVFLNSGHLDRLSTHLTAITPRNPNETNQLTLGCHSLADLLHQRGDQQGAISLWDHSQKINPNTGLPIAIRQKRIIAYKKLERTEEAMAEVKKLFLGEEMPAAGEMPLGAYSPAEEILSAVSLSDPTLVPPPTIAFHLAVDYGIALEIADTLEKSKGRPEQKAAARAVALALRIAARDPIVVAAAGQGGSYLKQLPKDLPTAGLALIAFELQQLSEGHRAASAVIGQILELKAEPHPVFKPINLLLWRLRLADFQADPKATTQAVDALAAHLLGSESDHGDAFCEAIHRLLLAGDLKRATQLAKKHEQKHRRPGPDLYSKDANAWALVDLHQGKAEAMPMIWTAPSGDETEVIWELANETSRSLLKTEVRATGAPIPALDQRYLLEIYGLDYHSERGAILEENKIATLPGIMSTGRWKGKIPREYPWLIAVLKDEAGNLRRSPPVPVLKGQNFLSPIKIGDILNKKGAWSASKWFWGSPLVAGPAQGTLFLSRLQPDVGLTTLKHQRFPIDPRSDYILSAWLKADSGQGEAGYSYDPDASIGVAFFDTEGKQVAEWKEPARIGGHWTLLTKQFGIAKGPYSLSLPPNAATAEVHLHLRTQCEIGDMGWYQIPD